MAKTTKQKFASGVRAEALELSARFAQIGEEPAISVARAEMFYDFLSDGKSLSQLNK